MYATAHRVLAPRDEVGVNAFLHLHHAAEPSFGVLAIDHIADLEPGELVAESLEVVPGSGNRVQSYLDVACPDDTPLPRILEALQHMETTLDVRQRPSIRSYPPAIVVRFDYVGALGEAEALEFKALRLAVEQLLEQRPRPSWMDRAPLVIEVQHKDDLAVFRLDEDSRLRVSRADDVRLPLNIIHIDLDTLAAFERLHGEIVRQILPMLTGLSVKRVREEGGAQLVRKVDGKLLWEWPLRS